jgi:hypothetical protein
MRELEATLQKHLGQIAPAQLVAQPPRHDQQHDGGGKLQAVERRGGALIEAAFAVCEAKWSIA